MVVISVYIYGVKIIKKFRWESGFLKPYALTEVRDTLCSQVLMQHHQMRLTIAHSKI